MKYIKVNYSTSEIVKLRNKSPEHYDYFISERHPSNSIKWNSYIGILERINDTIKFLNTVNFGTEVYETHAFDFYTLILHSDVIVKSIKKIADKMKLDISKIINSDDCFGEVRYHHENGSEVLKGQGNDMDFWNYLRSVSTIHPSDTTRKFVFKEPQTTNKATNPSDNEKSLHTSPYALWLGRMNFFNYKGDISITVYPDSHTFSSRHIVLYIKYIERFVNKWLAFLNIICQYLDELTIEHFESLKIQTIKTINEFNFDIVKYALYLETEYKKRFYPFTINIEAENFFSDKIGLISSIHFSNDYFSNLHREFVGKLRKDIVVFAERLQKLDADCMDSLRLSIGSYTLDKDLPDYLYYALDKVELLIRCGPNYYQDTEIIRQENYVINDLSDKIEKGLQIEDLGVYILHNYSFLDDPHYGKIMALILNKFLTPTKQIDYNKDPLNVYVQLLLVFWEDAEQRNNFIEV